MHKQATTLNASSPGKMQWIKFDVPVRASAWPNFVPASKTFPKKKNVYHPFGVMKELFCCNFAFHLRLLHSWTLIKILKKAFRTRDKLDGIYQVEFICGTTTTSKEGIKIPAEIIFREKRTYFWHCAKTTNDTSKFLHGCCARKKQIIF